MLISITQAVKRYAAPRATIVEAVSSGQLARHDHGDRLLVDTDELDAMFAPTPPLSPAPIEAVVTASEPEHRHHRRLPTPDELDAAVARALS